MNQTAQDPIASQAPEAPPRPVLDYLFEAPPQHGQTLEVAPGVLWLRMPLPYALDHINLWAIDDGQGWAIVDTGARTDEGVATWRALFSQSTDGRSLTRVFVTHMHPDHVGLAGWLTRKFHVPLYMTRLEYLNCRVVVSDCSREARPTPSPSTAAQAGATAHWSPTAPASATSASTSMPCPTATAACTMERNCA